VGDVFQAASGEGLTGAEAKRVLEGVSRAGCFDMIKMMASEADRRAIRAALGRVEQAEGAAAAATLRQKYGC
jgi:hypothetical protein